MYRTTEKATVNHAMFIVLNDILLMSSVFYIILVWTWLINTKIKIAPSVDEGHILIRTLVTVLNLQRTMRDKCRSHLADITAMSMRIVLLDEDDTHAHGRDPQDGSRIYSLLGLQMETLIGSLLLQISSTYSLVSFSVSTSVLSFNSGSCASRCIAYGNT